MVWRFLKNLKIELPYDPASLLLGVYPESALSCHRDICTPMLIAALFTAARKWNLPRCASTDEGIEKMCNVYKMVYYSALKMKSQERKHWTGG